MFSRDNSGPRARRRPAPPTIISSDINVRGDLSSDGEIQIEGTVEGDVQGMRLTIGTDGAVVGAVSADSAVVRGRVTGHVRARMVTLAKTARVKGDVYHETLTIEPGAQLDGHCRRLNAVDDVDNEGVSINLVVSDGRPALPRS